MNELERDIYGDLFGEGGDDADLDLDTSDLDKMEIPDFDEEGDGDDDIDAMLSTITSGDSGDPEDDDEDDDLSELENEYNAAAAASAGAMDNLGDDDLEDDVPDEEEECGGTNTECGGEACNSEDGEDVVPLTPDSDAEGDRLLEAIATPDLIENTLTDDEYDDFVESGDIYTAVAEGLISDAYLEEALSGDDMDGIFTESAKFAPEGRKYKMTKKARLRQLYEISLQIEARLHHDSYYPKMMKVYAIRRKIRAQWRKRYHALAMKRAKKYLRKIMMSKSNGVSTMAHRLVGGKPNHK
jgi:hypothetical protein